MIYLDGYNLTQNEGLRMSRCSGIFDWPSIKQFGTDWSGEDFVTASERKQDYQYESRRITLECFVKGANWAALETQLNNIASAIKYDGLKMLVLPTLSNRGYMVRLNSTTIFKPFRYFNSGKCVASFQIVLIEPQPFNIQWSFFYPSSEFQLPPVYVKIEDTTSVQSTDSFEQKFITVTEPFTPESTEVNLEAEFYELSRMFPIEANIPYPLIITGEVDNVDEITISAESEPLGLDIAELFTRGGNVIYTEL